MSTPGHRNNFNLLRLIAASLVIVSHGIELPTGIAQRDWAFQVTGFSFAWYAVSLFFVISGFLVTESWRRSEYLPAFVSARVLRIWPGLLVMLALTVFVLGPAMTNIGLIDYFTSSMTWKYALRTASILTGVTYNLPGVFDNLPLQTVNGSLWTLFYEVWFYIGILALGALGLLANTSRVRLIGLIAIVVTALIAVGTQIVAARLSGVLALSLELGRLGFAFSLGMAYSGFRDKISLRLPIVVALIAVAAATTGTPLFVVTSSLALAYGCLWIAYVPNASFLRPTQDWPDYSYGLYIYAFPVQQLLVALLPDPQPWQIIVLGFLCTLPFAALSWHFIESRALSQKARFKKKSIFPHGQPTPSIDH